MPALGRQSQASPEAVATIDTEVGQIKAVTDVLPDAGALTGISDETDKIDNAAADGLAGTSGSVAYETGEVERHTHNRNRFWGAAGSPTETNAIDANVGRPFVAISGNDDWGTAIPICGTSDAPVPSPDNDQFDADELLVVDTDHVTPYRIRLIWGTGTSADAITAGQWSETMFMATAGPFDTGVPVIIKMRRVDVGAKLWAQVWNATNLSEVDFYWGVHGYAG